MKRLNSIQSLENRLSHVYYSEINGAFHICSRYKNVENKDYKIICGTHTNIADSFVKWASKFNNLSNQPDKPFDFIGDKPEHSKIVSDWELFASVYKSITINDKR